jgi:hypothetical protein
MNDNLNMLRLAKLAGLRKDHASDREYIGDFDWRLFGDLVVAEVLHVQSKLVMIDGVNAYHLDAPTKEHFGVW